jgi:hypothetical protein
LKSRRKQLSTQVTQWFSANPCGSVKQCAAAFGISTARVYQITAAACIQLPGQPRADVRHEEYFATLEKFQTFCRARELGFTVVLNRLMRDFMDQSSPHAGATT